MSLANHREHPAYMVFMLALSVLSIVGLALSTRTGLDPAIHDVLGVADDAVCVAFFADFLHSLYVAENRWRYFLRWGWLDLLSSVPMLDVLRATRFARILRILRVIRALRAAKIILEFVLMRRAEHAFLAVLLLSMLSVVLGAIMVLQFETGPLANIHTGEDALWWAMTTITSVGYGDKFPLSTEGRLVAAGLMVAGLGLLGTFSGFVASWFLKPGERSQDEDLTQLLAEVRQLRESVEAMRAGVR
jgi:voltage-gated potassium channel